MPAQKLQQKVQVGAICLIAIVIGTLIISWFVAGRSHVASIVALKEEAMTAAGFEYWDCIFTTALVDGEGRCQSRIGACDLTLELRGEDGSFFVQLPGTELMLENPSLQSLLELDEFAPCRT